MILSILFVWRRSDLFNVSLITGYVILHNQTTLYITLSNLVFTSHCICFDYITIWPVSSAYTIGVTSFAWLGHIGCWLTLNRSLFGLFVSCLFCLPDTDLFHASSEGVTGFVSFAFTVYWLTLSRSLFRFYCIWRYLLTRH